MQPALLLVLSLWFASGPPEEAQDAVKQLYEDYDYQEQLFPERVRRSSDAGGNTQAEDPAPEANHPRGRTWSRDGWREDLRREIEEHRGRADERGDPRRRELEQREVGYSGGGALASLLEVLVWVVLAVCAVTVVAALVRNREGRAAELTPTLTDSGTSPPAALDAPRSEAELLAEQGRYDEAVHLLLLKTIEALIRARPGGLPEAWTSREIQRAMPMPEPARAPFGALVDTVEASLFGGRPVDASAWNLCFERFRAFESAYTPRRA